MITLDFDNERIQVRADILAEILEDFFRYRSLSDRTLCGDRDLSTFERLKRHVANKLLALARKSA